MRVLHFLHLAGLASLVASLFTPPNTSVTSKSRPMNTMLLSSLVLLVLTPSVHATDRDYWWDKRSSPRKPLHQAITTRSDPTDNNWQKGPGEVKLCKANGCIPISANGKCVVFPEKSTDKLLWIQQDQGSTCLYYMHDKICDKADPQLVTRSYTGMEYVCVGDECTGVNSVICKDSSSKGEDEGALKHVDTRSEDPFTDVVAMPGESKIDEPDQLSLCNDTWQGMQCNHISANNKCVVFPETTANILMWIGQYEGVVCKYYLRDQRCDIDNPAHVVSTIGGYLQACIGAECSGIHSAICKDKWWPGTEHVESPEPSQQPEPPKFRQMVESSLPDDRLTTRAENINLDGPGETVICEKTWGDGRCDTLSVNNACVNIPEGLAHRVGSVYQAQGSICKYFDGPCPVSSPTIALNSHRHPVGMILSQSLGSKIGYLMCRDQWTAGRDDPGLQPSGTQPFVMHMNGEDSDENLASVKHLLNDQASTSTASHLLMCNSKDFQGLCLGASQSNSCTRAAIEIKSFAIERGTQ